MRWEWMKRQTEQTTKQFNEKIDAKLYDQNEFTVIKMMSVQKIYFNIVFYFECWTYSIYAFCIICDVSYYLFTLYIISPSSTIATHILLLHVTVHIGSLLNFENS